jgi:hypothetical protein
MNMAAKSKQVGNSSRWRMATTQLATINPKLATHRNHQIVVSIIP